MYIYLSIGAGLSHTLMGKVEKHEDFKIHEAPR